MKNIKVSANLVVVALACIFLQINAQQVSNQINKMPGQDGGGIQKKFYQYDAQLNKYLADLKNRVKNKADQANLSIQRQVNTEEIKNILNQKFQQLKDDINLQKATINASMPSKKILLEKAQQLKQQLDNATEKNKELFLEKAKEFQKYLNDKYEAFKNLKNNAKVQ